MSKDLTLDRYAQFLKMEEKRRSSILVGLPGIDPFHGYGGYSAVPRCLRIIAAMSEAERANPERCQPSRFPEIAAVAEVASWEVEQLVTEFLRMREVVARVARLSWWQRVLLLLGWRPTALDVD